MLYFGIWQKEGIIVPKKYCVEGSFQGRHINVVVDAFSEKQAKLKAGFKGKVPGREIKKFSKSASARKL